MCIRDSFTGAVSFGADTDIGAVVGGSATAFSGAAPPLNDGRNRHASANASKAIPAALPSTFCLMTKSLPGIACAQKVFELWHLRPFVACAATAAPAHAKTGTWLRGSSNGKTQTDA